MSNSSVYSPSPEEINLAIVWGQSPECSNEIARDIASKSKQWTLSPRQGEALVKMHRWAEQRQVEAAIRAAAGVVAPEGKASVSGEVVKVSSEETQWGWVTKVIVQMPCGARVRGNAPKRSAPLVGDQVKFSATFTRAAGDPSFAFWSRATDWVKTPVQS